MYRNQCGPGSTTDLLQSTGTQVNILSMLNVKGSSWGPVHGQNKKGYENPWDTILKTVPLTLFEIWAQKGTAQKRWNHIRIRIRIHGKVFSQ